MCELMRTVEAGDRLVEDHQIGPVDHRLRDPDALAEAVGELSDDPIPDLRDLADLHDVGQVLLDPRARPPLDLAAPLEKLAYPHLAIKWRLLREKADPPPQRVRGLDGIDASDPDRPCGWQQQAGEDHEYGRLAGTVEAEEADDLAILNLEGDIEHCGRAPVVASQALDLDHVALRIGLARPQGTGGREGWPWAVAVPGTGA
jgi:hypothetical protein